MMRQVYGDSCLSHAQIFKWYARFKSGVETIEDEARPGRPFSVRNDGLIVPDSSIITCVKDHSPS